MAKLIIHRGTHQIGGCCTELSVDGQRIFRCCYEPEQPEDWEPWDLDTAKRLEAERYAEEAALFGEADGQP